MPYSDLLIEQIKDSVNIVDIARERIKDAKEHGGNITCCCPIHPEKTPSFFISESRQTFKCFGCGEGGDVIELVCRLDRVSFPQAVRLLADHAGINIKGEKLTEAEEQKLKKQYLLKTQLKWCNEKACEFYQKQLDSCRSRNDNDIPDYLKSRNIEAEDIEKWRIGFAPAKGLKGYLAEKANGKKDAAISAANSAGLIGESESGYEYERFQNRITFPICDIAGNVVGFTARKHDWQKGDKYGKYINSNASDIFDKSKTLYGLDMAAEEIRKSGSCIIVEGTLDVIAMHKAGFCNTVATLGTALTSCQMRLLSRFCSQITCMFDGDSAGLKASDHAISIALAENIAINIITLEGLDPADLAFQHSQAGLAQIINSAVDGFDWLLRRKFADTASAASRSATAKSIISILSKCRDKISCGLYLKSLSEHSGIDLNTLKKEFKGTKRSDSPRTPGDGGFAQPARNRTGTADDWLSSEVACDFLSESQRIIFYKDEFYRYTGKCYKLVPLGQMRAEVISFINRTGHGKPTVNFAGNVLGNISASGVIDYDYTPPAFLNKPPFDKNNLTGNLISFDNGVLDVHKMLTVNPEQKLLPHSDNLFSLIALPYNYDMDAVADNWLEFLDTVLPDKSLQNTLQEWFGYCLLPTQKYQKMMLMVGEGANGKSVITDVLKQMIGAQNCSAMQLESLDKPHSTVSLVGKLVNFSSEFTRAINDSEGVLKMITGGDEVEINPKHRSPYSMPIYARMVITSNNPPKINDKSDGLWRRLIIIPFDIQIATDKQRNKDVLVAELCQDLPGILNWAVHGLMRLFERDKFTKTKASIIAEKDYKLSSNNALSFCEDKLEVNQHGWVDKDDLYNKYRNWVSNNGYNYTAPKPDFCKETIKWAASQGLDTESITKRKVVDGSRKRVFYGFDIMTEDYEYDVE